MFRLKGPATTLAADGRSATATPLKTLSAADFNALFGTSVASGGFRSLEVTDDGEYAFFVMGQRYSGSATTELKIVTSPGMYDVTSIPFERRTLAILRRAELGFLGVFVLTAVHTPRF